MKFKMTFYAWSPVTVSDLIAEGIKATPIVEEDYLKYIVEIETLEQVVALVKKYKTDFVITCNDVDDAFFFNGYYEE